MPQRALRGFVLLAALGCIAILAGASRTAEAVEDLERLLTDYRAHGLPLPPEEARLVIPKIHDGTTNGVPQCRHQLAFAVGEGDQTNYWFGCEPLRSTHRATDRDAPLTREAVEQTQPAEPEHWYEGFPPYPDLALAVQCKARGWNELAAALLERSGRRLQSKFFDQRRPRPRNDLARMLIAHGAEDVNAKDYRGETPLYEAEYKRDSFFPDERNREPVAKLLREHGGIK